MVAASVAAASCALTDFVSPLPLATVLLELEGSQLADHLWEHRRHLLVHPPYRRSALRHYLPASSSLSLAALSLIRVVEEQETGAQRGSSGRHMRRRYHERAMLKCTMYVV